MNKTDTAVFLSIIIPVYNVEKYLRECLDSCLEQNVTSEEYEIICVDDGSPDNCGKILDEYALQYSNIRVIHKENGGLSSARNAGLDVAIGKYVWFVDSDDFIGRNILADLFDILKKTIVMNCLFRPMLLKTGNNMIFLQYFHQKKVRFIRITFGQEYIVFQQ